MVRKRDGTSHIPVYEMNEKLMKPFEATSSDPDLHDCSPAKIACRPQHCPDNNASTSPTAFQSISIVSQQIINCAHEGIVVYGADLHYQVWNPYMEKLTGIPADEILGKHPREVFPFLESEGVISLLERALQGETTTEITFRFMLPTTGRVGWALDSSSPLRDDHGNIIGVVGIVRDITERKLVQDAQEFLAQFDPISAGNDFFMSLAQFLAESLDMEFVCIDHLSGDEKRAQTVAYYVDGIFEDNVEYALKDTPCGELVGKSVCCFPKNVRRLFSKDQVLQDLRAESYIGTTLWDAEKKAIGLIAVIGRKPLEKPELAESMLRLISLRAAAELEQRIAAAALKEANLDLELKVSERTRDLQKSHNLLEDLSRQVPGVIYQFRQAPDGRYSIPYASAALCEIFELSPEDVRESAAPLFDRIHPDHFDAAMKSFQESVRFLSPWKSEYQVLLPVKGLRWIGGISKPLQYEDGSIIWHGFASDITERKLAEQELEEQRSQLSEAQRQANIGSWHWITETGEISWSENLYIITGRDPELGCICYEDQSHMYTPESWTLLDSAVTKALETGESYELELDLIRADNSHRICIAKGEIVLDQNGLVTGLHGTLQDITERIQLERQLYQAKKLESIGHLVVGVAHEVRNPLNAILLITEALFQETEIRKNNDYIPYITHIRAQVTRLAQLMNDLLDLGKPVAPASLLPAHLYDICSDSIELWNSSGSAQKLPVLLTAASDLSDVYVTVDSVKLQQTLFNLLDNAAQNSPEESNIKVCLSVPAKSDTFTNCASILITDAGCGIQEINIQRIFDPFFSTRIEGTGLGLSLVRHFIESMGGSVRIWNNNPPPGSTVELCLPLAVKENP